MHEISIELREWIELGTGPGFNLLIWDMAGILFLVKDEWHEWQHNILELATKLKPALFKLLLVLSQIV